MTAIAIDFGGTEIKTAVVSNGHVLAAAHQPNHSRRADLQATARQVNALLADCGQLPVGVGVAMPGVITADGRSLLAAHEKYDYAIGLDICEWAENEWGVPATAENDGRASLIGELHYGCARDYDDVVMVILGTGIGSAAAMDGHVLRGRTGHAGILGGHITVDINGPTCPCGNAGCAEALASTWALRDYVRARVDEDSTGFWAHALASGSLGYAQVAQRRLDDPIAAGAFDRALQIWGAATVTMCHAYDPQAVIVAGGVARAGRPLRDGIQQWVDQHLWSSATRPVFLSPSAPEQSVLLGVAFLAEQFG